jgi:APA family basic amino acid/polyamine antiporter
LESAALLFFAYTGYARIATLGEEVRDPRRVIPRAIIITMAGAVVLYIAVALAAVGAVGAVALASSSAPLQAAAAAFQPPWVALVVSIGGVAAMLGVILSQLLGLSRMAFAMARRNDLPRFFEHVHSRYQAPGRAVIVIGAVAAIVAGTGTLRGAAAAASFTILVYYAIANVAALRMPSETKLFNDAIPLVGLVACGLLAMSLTSTVILTGLSILGIGLIFRFVFKRVAAARR